MCAKSPYIYGPISDKREKMRWRVPMPATDLKNSLAAKKMFHADNKNKKKRTSGVGKSIPHFPGKPRKINKNNVVD